MAGLRFGILLLAVIGAVLWFEYRCNRIEWLIIATPEKTTALMLENTRLAVEQAIANTITRYTYTPRNEEMK